MSLMQLIEPGCVFSDRSGHCIRGLRRGVSFLAALTWRCGRVSRAQAKEASAVVSRW